MLATEESDDLVLPEDACPLCAERRADFLIWTGDDRVECAMCGTVYTPPSLRSPE